MPQKSTTRRSSHIQPYFMQELLERRQMCSITPIAVDNHAVRGSEAAVTFQFADSDPVDPGNFIFVSVDPGDGSANVPGTITQPAGSGGAFQVKLNHTYQATGQFTAYLVFHDLTTMTNDLMQATVNVDAEGSLTPVIYSAGGNTQMLVEKQAFASAIGGANNGRSTGSQSDGFRLLGFDGVRMDGSDFAGKDTVITADHTVAVPRARFQSHGIMLAHRLAISNDGFADVDPSLGAVLLPASGSNDISAYNQPAIGIQFVEPQPRGSLSSTSATAAFGATFINVTQAGAVGFECFAGSDSLGVFHAPPAGAGQASFIGVQFRTSRITSVLLIMGAEPLFHYSGNLVTAAQTGAAAIAADDLLFAEPKIVLIPAVRLNHEPALTGSLQNENPSTGMSPTTALSSSAAILA